MKRVSKWETSDGLLHDSFYEAKSHAENRYDLQLSKMAHELVVVEKYTEMLDKLNGFTGSMKLLLALGQDLKVDAGDCDEV